MYRRTFPVRSSSGGIRLCYRRALAVAVYALQSRWWPGMRVTCDAKAIPQGSIPPLQLYELTSMMWITQATVFVV